MPTPRRRRFRPQLCGNLGLQRAARKLINDGNAGNFTDPDDWEEWLGDVLDGETPDTLFDAGWQSSCGSAYCRRARACKRDLRHGSR